MSRKTIKTANVVRFAAARADNRIVLYSEKANLEVKKVKDEYYGFEDTVVRDKGGRYNELFDMCAAGFLRNTGLRFKEGEVKKVEFLVREVDG